ncbi:MAG TPA: NAD(P)H-binding protein [Candidatus Limnocylindrales bacterium]
MDALTGQPATGRTHAVTGAFGFTGRAIAEALLARGDRVVTLTHRRPAPDDPLAPHLAVAPLDFGRPADLGAALDRVDTLYNTYWIRFPRGRRTFERAVADSAVLFAAAREAGVRRIVHISVVGADPRGATPYVRAKGTLEGMLRSSRVEWAIVRPTLTYGLGDILVNNIAWSLRHLPVFAMPGRGRYPIQPVHVADVARICLDAADGRPGGIADAAGPETLEYRELVGIIRRAVAGRALVLPMPHAGVRFGAKVLGLMVRDVVLTGDEIRELTSGLLTSKERPRGTISFPEWVQANADALGRRWSSELARNFARRR